MKQEELMIGDWVQSKSDQSIFQIKTHWDIYNAKDFEPIPITPEILEMNGFDKGSLLGCDVWTFDIQNGDNFDNISLRKIKYNKKHKWAVGLSIYGEGAGRFFIDNIHELQHALRLCKIDKEIEL